MKRGITILILLAILIFPTVPAETPMSSDLTKQIIPPFDPKLSTTDQPNLNPWNETIIISPVWQNIIGTFFGLNLKEVSKEISTREALTFFAIFIMFLVIILDILKLTPFFKTKIFDIVSGEFIAATIITILVSISGAFINLKNLFLQAVAFTITKLDWDWINTTKEYTLTSSIITGIIIVMTFLIIWNFFDWINPRIKRYSAISRAQAKGRLLSSVIEKQDI